MNKLFYFTLIVFTSFSTYSSAQLKVGGISVKKAASATADAVKGITLSDADVMSLSKDAVDWMDANNKVSAADSPYTERLNKLTKNLKEVNGIPLNFKVYEVIDINAFACADGSIRIFSSLMDIMTDDELLAIIGHEIGHIAGSDRKDAMKRTYMTSAAIKAAGSVSGKMEKLTESQLGELTKSLLSAKFSQKQEFEADEYGFKVCIENGADPYGMANSLYKLVELSCGMKDSRIQQMFSSHPDSEKRAEKMEKKAEKYIETKKN